MKDFIDLLIEREKENRKYFENYMEYARQIKEIVKKYLKDVKVFVFGSVVRGDYRKSSDIDILVISKHMPRRLSERAEIKAEIYREIGFSSPFEIHMVTPEEYEWYERFIDNKVEV